MRIFIYSRKSVYTGKGDSVENQIEMCKNYIMSKFAVPEEPEIFIYEDEGFSAKNTDRPHFQQMLRDLKIHKPDYIICYRLDRISRSVSDFSAFIEMLSRENISFISIKEEFDTSKPMGKAMMYIASVFAQLERETIAERVRDNMLMLAKDGRWLGGTTPTGFSSEKIQKIIIDGKAATVCKLKDNPAELKVIDCIFEKYDELRSISGVSKYLIKNNILSRSGKMFSLLAIKDILQNPVYCIADEDARDYFTKHNADVCFEKSQCSNKYGLSAYNKRDYRKKNAPRNPIDKWIIAIGKHKGRISGEKWVSIQDALKNNSTAADSPGSMHNHYSLLSGLITCEKCNQRMFAKQRSRNPKLFDYICNGKLRGGNSLCSCQNINGLQADDTVCEHLLQYMDESSGIYKLLEQLKHSLRTFPQTTDHANSIKKRIAQCEQEIDHLIQTLSQGSLEHTFVKRINDRIVALDQEILSLKQEQVELKNTENTSQERLPQIDLLAAALSSLKDNFKDLSIEEKRTLIRLIVEKITWDGENLHIFIHSG